jgi:hypothetical protein
VSIQQDYVNGVCYHLSSAVGQQKAITQHELIKQKAGGSIFGILIFVIVSSSGILYTIKSVATPETCQFEGFRNKCNKDMSINALDTFLYVILILFNFLILSMLSIPDSAYLDLMSSDKLRESLCLAVGDFEKIEKVDDQVYVDFTNQITLALKQINLPVGDPNYLAVQMQKNLLEDMVLQSHPIFIGSADSES